MELTKNCKTCDKEFITPKSSPHKAYCNTKCKNSYLNKIHQIYSVQKSKAIIRKLAAIKKLGGACGVCGYEKNLAGLSFHHLDPKSKSLTLSLREFANNSQATIDLEIDKCILLCIRCHMEVEYPHLNIESLRQELNL